MFTKCHVIFRQTWAYYYFMYEEENKMILAIIVGVITGVIASWIAWWVLYHIGSPKIGVSEYLKKIKSKNNKTGYNYQFKLGNLRKKEMPLIYQ